MSFEPVYPYTLGLADEFNLNSLGIIYNALPGRKLQADFQAWALGLYPDLWAELEKKGRQGTDETGINFKISRELRA